MHTPDNRYATQTPFHTGEKAMQARTGMSERMDSIGGQIIRSYMPDQHRQFFSQLPFMIIGSVDQQGQPWASVIAGKPGFIASPSPTALEFMTQAITGDPLQNNLQVGAPLGLLGIELPTRRRNRMNAHISHASDSGFSISVDQSFGNCPQYIQTRSVTYTQRQQPVINDKNITHFSTLDDSAQRWIAEADTFFVSSYVPADNNPDTEGVDVSHRGGQAGFIKVQGDTLTIPDFSGNFLFMTLGNFVINPKAGLLFIDFQSGDLMMLTGSVTILAEDDPEIKDIQGAERGWTFTLEHGVRIENALPFQFEFGEYSPRSLATGRW
jgi:predicted pyridoxine 5'-phosphate oxidase superfamily flavin-nucleotide-binding protein